MLLNGSRCSMKRGKYKKRKPKPIIEKKEVWVQKDGRTMDDIIFTNGKIDIGFDEYVRRIME